MRLNLEKLKCLLTTKGGINRLSVLKYHRYLDHIDWHLTAGKGFDRSLPESTDLTKERYENIYVCINDGKIKTWPALPDGYLESHANADGPDRSLAIPLSDGRYKVQPGDWLKIDGHWYRYVGTKEMTVDGPGTRKGKKYWERVE